MYTVSPIDIEKYPLRLLLLYINGPKSFKDLKTSPFTGIIYKTFKE